MGRGGKIGITLLVILLVLGSALVIADRIAVGMAEDRIAAQAKKELVSRSITTSGDPRVKISGFPFLTQVAAGRYDRISIDVDRPEANGVRLDTLKLVATTVRADTRQMINRSGTATADRVTGTATMGWDAVRQALEIVNLPGIDPAAIEVSVVNDQVRLRLPVAIAGLQAAAQATGTLQVDRGEIRLRMTSFSVENTTLPPALQRTVDQIRDQLSVTLKVPDMPYHLVVEKVQSSKAGVFVVASAHDVKLAG